MFLGAEPVKEHVLVVHVVDGADAGQELRHAQVGELVREELCAEHLIVHKSTHAQIEEAVPAHVVEKWPVPLYHPAVALHVLPSPDGCHGLVHMQGNGDDVLHQLPVHLTGILGEPGILSERHPGRVGDTCKTAVIRRLMHTGSIQTAHTHGREYSGAHLLSVGVLHLLEEEMHDIGSGDAVRLVGGHQTYVETVGEDYAVLGMKYGIPGLAEVPRQVLLAVDEIDAFSHQGPACGIGSAFVK